MSKRIRFTKHARRKFIDLNEIAFPVTEEQVIDTVLNPEYVDTSQNPPIAQKAISERYLLRVVFIEETDEIRVITFYPSRRSRYEPEDEV